MNGYSDEQTSDEHLNRPVLLCMLQIAGIGLQNQ